MDGRTSNPSTEYENHTFSKTRGGPYSIRFMGRFTIYDFPWGVSRGGGAMSICPLRTHFQNQKGVGFCSAEADDPILTMA